VKIICWLLAGFFAKETAPARGQAEAVIPSDALGMARASGSAYPSVLAGNGSIPVCYLQIPGIIYLHRSQRRISIRREPRPVIPIGRGFRCRIFRFDHRFGELRRALGCSTGGTLFLVTSQFVPI
jgi:hypothetical protein